MKQITRKILNVSKARRLYGRKIGDEKNYRGGAALNIRKKRRLYGREFNRQYSNQRVRVLK